MRLEFHHYARRFPAASGTNAPSCTPWTLPPRWRALRLRRQRQEGERRCSSTGPRRNSARRCALSSADRLPPDVRHKVVSGMEIAKDDYMRWHRALYERGWVAPTWPEEHGGAGWTPAERYIFDEEAGLGGRAQAFRLRPRHGGPGADGLRHGGAEGRAPAEDPLRRARLVPRLFRARLRLRPRLPQDPGGAGRRGTMSSTARRSGPRSPTMRTGSSASCAPATSRKSRTASRSSSSR